MYYEERWIDGKFCWRTSPNGAWTAYTANELAHRYQAELQRAHDAQRALDALQAQLARWKEALGEWGGLGGCGYEGRNNERANAAQIEGGA